MSRYIDADEAKKVINGIDSYFAKFIDDIPTADVRENVRGEWIYLDGLNTFECSVCGRQMVRNIFDYCPWCGAYLRKEVE